MSFSITANPYSNYQAPAFVGMKEDSMDDNVDTFACGPTAIPVGVAVQRTAANAITIKPGTAAGLAVGIALHDQIVAYWGTWPQLYLTANPSYQPTQAVSVLTRGRAWVAVSAATGIADGVAASADPATGQFNTTGTAVQNAVFRTTAISLYNADFTTSVLAAVVELHNPWV